MRISPESAHDNPLHTSEHPNNQEPDAADPSDCAKENDTVEHDTHVDSAPLSLLVVVHVDPLQATSVEYHSRQDQIAEHPADDDSGSETLVIILMLFLSRGDLLGWCPLGRKDPQLVLVLAVQVMIVSRNSHVDLAAWFCGGTAELLWLVIALGSPCDVVGIAKGIDVEDVDVGRGQEEVLYKAGEHVPWIEEEDGGDEVKDVGRQHRKDECPKESVCEEIREGEAAGSHLCLHRLDRDEDSGKHQVHHQDGPEVYLRHVKFVGSLWSITKREDETGDKNAEVEEFEYYCEDITWSEVEGRLAQRRRQDSEDEEEVALSLLANMVTIDGWILTIANQANNMLINW